MRRDIRRAFLARSHCTYSAPFRLPDGGSSFDVVVLPLHRYGGTKAVVVYPVFLRLNAVAFIFYLGCTTASRTRAAFIRGRRLIVLCLVETLKE